MQFDHRVLAGLTACGVGALWAFLRLSPSVAAIPHRAKMAMDLVAAITVAQVSLGVWTLLEMVPPHLGSAHQANALNLFTAVLWTLHALRPSMPGPRAASLSRFVTPAAITGVLGIGVAVTTNN
ncbi:hypothetical protein DUNSADRAFT_1618 [Dunaliella salina]|uniref:Uncharacterized protein n=1 Tax=Dunaliella salina TaxID=3046 RepID=A0ABQ7H8K6_DUNSA|nr:hypothetical protein DUNSADRAFT_1618 [Dunaliella salina]|eukprot:KAF5843191.1 hypothetical protein DUNSADRAFT_1618 [Dunaliella salina]